MATNTSQDELLDFSQPWKQSDAVLVVEEERFHVHRSVLGIWSPVFLTMFTAKFKEQTADEIPLPGKKASEIEELLLVIYPTSTKQIDESNYLFLLDLAKEYMMTKLTKSCEVYMISRLNESMDNLSPFYCLELLTIAEEYELNMLEKACIDTAKGAGFDDMKKHNNYTKISSSNYRAIVEERIEKMENELRDKENELNRLKSNADGVKSKVQEATEELQRIVSIIACYAGQTGYSFFDSQLNYIRYSAAGDLKNLYDPLSALKLRLKSIEQYSSQ